MGSSPQFIYGPKDGGYVPDILWILDEIELAEKTKNGIMIHLYKVNNDTHNYEYAGCYPEESR